jgi:hypothetical protein
VTIPFLKDGVHHAAISRAISADRQHAASGIGFSSHIYMKVGLEVNCRLPLENNTWIEMVMIIRHCVRLTSKLYNVGASFNRPAPKGENRQPLQPAQSSAALN